MIVKNNMLAFCVCYLSICAELLSQMLATGGDLGRVSRQRLSRFTAKPAEGPPASCIQPRCSDVHDWCDNFAVQPTWSPVVTLHAGATLGGGSVPDVVVQPSPG